MKLSGHTILITGGTGGIGYALAARLLKLGNIVLITGRTEERLASARQTLAGVHTFVCDQSDPEAISRLSAEVARAFPALDMLINNAGIGLKRNLNDTGGDLGDLAREITTNLTGPIQLIQAFLPQLKRQKEATIVNVTSGLGFVPLPMKPIYCATKAAMHSYTQSLRVQLRLSSVRVVELAPPAVATDFNKGQEDMNIGHRMSAEALVRAAIKGLKQDREEILAGPVPILRLIGRLNPRATLRTADAEKMGAQG